MTEKNIAVFGIFRDSHPAEQALNRLIASGFMNDDVSILLPAHSSSKDFGHEKNSKAPEGVTAGVTAGGVLGGALGLLAGIGVLAIPGMGPLIAAGPIMASLAGIGAGGAVGGVIGSLVGMGIPEYEAKRYEGRVKAGGVLPSVHCDTDAQIATAKDMLKETGAEDIASAGEGAADHVGHVKINRAAD